MPHIWEGNDMRTRSLCAMIGVGLALSVALGTPAAALAEEVSDETLVATDGVVADAASDDQVMTDVDTDDHYEDVGASAPVADEVGEDDPAKAEPVIADDMQPVEDDTETGVATEGAAVMKAQARAVGSSTQQQQLDALAKQTAGDVPDGEYAIYSEAPAKYSGDAKKTFSLDVRGNKKTTDSHTATSIVYTAAVKDNQRWVISHLATGYATVKSVSTGQYLSLLGGDDAYADGKSAQVVLWDYEEGARWQTWIIERTDDGLFKLISGLLKNGETCVLDVRGGKAANSVANIVYADKGTDNQRWKIQVTEDIYDKEAKRHRAVLPNGTYLVESGLKSSYVLNVRGASVANGASIILYAKGPALNEGFGVTHDDKGYVILTNSKSGKVLDVRGGKAKDGAQIIQWTDKDNGARNQRWIVTLKDGKYTLTSALVGDVRYVLTVTGGVAEDRAAISLGVQRNGGAASQAWTVAAAPRQYAHARDVADGTYLIRTPLDVTKVLDVSRASKESGAAVKLYQCKLSDNQYWILSHDDQGYVRLKNKNSGLYLSFDSNYAAVQSKTARNFIVELGSDARYVIRDAKTNRVLDLSKSQTANGSAIIAYKETGGTNQQWMIAKPIRIAIDPGHGGYDSGAVGNGLRECDLTWKISQACIAQLKAYGFDVYLTVSESEFKNGATVSIYNRVERAYKAGCAAIFSMHVNAGGGTGAVVLVPNNSSYHYEYYTMGQRFAKTLLPKINALGIGTWGDGAWERNYGSGYTYPDGSMGDYYGIVRYARARGMFGVIIEHGFIDNSREAAILRQAAALTALGKADAAAIRALYV